MTTAVEHLELQAVRPGLAVTSAGQEIGRLEDVVPQPDNVHIARLITRVTAPKERLVAIPIDWVQDIRDGRIELWVSKAELDELPDFLPAIPAAEARQRVQRALDEHPVGGGIRVTERDGTLELRGTVADAATRATASAVARSVPGIGPVRNLLGTSSSPNVSATGYAYPWLHTLLERTTHLELDEGQIARIADIAERKLVDLFDVAEDAALANGRGRVMRHDLPLTKGLQLVLLEIADLAREFELEPLLVFLADAGIRTHFDDEMRADIPRLMAALLIVTARVVALLDTSGPALDRASAILDLTL
jgi:sporulation protein YlmC with PRC-barrel domain